MPYDKVVDSAKLDGAMSATADAIRGKTGGAGSIAWDEDTGFADAVDEVYEAGEKSEYDAFWDAYQDYGNRVRYDGAFAGTGWTQDTLKPKYPVKANTVGSMFFYCNRYTTESDESTLLDFSELNSMFDFSAAESFESTFLNARIKNLYVDGSNATKLTSTFNASNGGYVENLTLKVTEKTTSFSTAFDYQYHMKNIIFTDDSVIAASIGFKQSSKLTKASITSIINALSSSASGKTLTLSKTAKDKAFTDAEWSALIATKTNWTISLV